MPSDPNSFPNESYVVWLTQGVARPVPDAWQQSHTDWIFQLLDLPTGLDTTQLSEWLVNAVRKPCMAILCVGISKENFSSFSAVLKNQKEVLLAQVPLFWVTEGTKDLKGLGNLNFHDLLSLKMTCPEVRERLRLQYRQFQERVQWDLDLKEHSARTAKAETILKQREEFLGVCAHDLRSPLGLIQSAINLVLKEEEKATVMSPFQAELLKRAKRQATNAISLVNDLLDVMSFEQGLNPHYEMLNLHQLLSEFYADYKLQAEQKGITFHYENTITHWRILGDANRIRQLLQNLFVNAVKFTESGKNIYLRTTPFIGRRRLDPDYPMIIISIKDEGKGIPQKEQERIFDRFAQIKGHSSPEGRGLGLTVAKQISQLHEGNIWLESKEGEGSTFYVLFPHVVNRRVQETIPYDKLSNLVLIAEASEAKRELIRETLSGRKVELLFAKDGVEAVALFHRLPRLLLLPMQLPRLSSSEVVKISKADAATASVSVVVHMEAEQQPDQSLDTKLIDRLLPFPFASDALDDFLEIKKAAA